MGVTTEHWDYIRHKTQWKRCEDVIAGQDAVKAAGVTYLPMLSGQKDEDYTGYKGRAQFFNATGRTVDALTGMVFSRPPMVEMPTALEEMVRDVTLTGCTLAEFVNELTEEVVGVGRVGLLVDFPQIDTKGMTLAEMRASGARPYMRSYDALNIINWRTEIKAGVEVLTMVVLKETVCRAVDDFTWEDVMQYRVLELKDGVYTQRIGTPGKTGDSFGETITPTMNGKPLNFIPFRFINASYTGPYCDTPPMLDLVDTNIAHYRNSADYEHGLHFTGLPQPYIAGVTLADGESFSVGSPEAWVFSAPDAKAAYLEFDGQGLQALEKAIEKKEHRMAVLGARMLMDEKKAAEAVEAIQIRFGGERNVLASIARSVSLGVEWGLNVMTQWASIGGTVKYELNTDYKAARMTHQMLTALVESWQKGAITQETLFRNLKRGDIIDVNKDAKEYAKELDDEAPDEGEQGGLMRQLRAGLGLGGAE